MSSKSQTIFLKLFFNESFLMKKIKNVPVFNTGTCYNIKNYRKGINMDTKFSIALHLLIYIEETDKLVTSELLAQSVGTNASHIRKIIALLKDAILSKANKVKRE